MKRYYFLLIALICFAPLFAQTPDSLLWSRNIFDLIQAEGPYGNRATITQSSSLKQAVQNQINQNESKKIQGFRIRIFSSNAQTARGASLAAKEEFESLFPGTRAYQKFENIDWRVTVGDFRSRSEAMRFHKEITAYARYRAAVIVKEAIEFPEL
ncbi:MAG: hypothetical protein FWD56_03210 [Bacteroidales bacterium]|nr:hypothetical protein [Bacteroidales bacterium]